MTVTRFRNEYSGLEELIEQEYARLCGVSTRLIGRNDVAEDIVQNCFVSLWDKKQRNDKIDSESGLLYVMVRNESLNYLRSLKRERQRNEVFIDESLRDSNDEESMTERLLQEEIGNKLDAALELLPAQTQRIIKMSLMGMGNRDIASTLGITVNSVKTLKYSAIKKIKEIVQK